MTSLASQQKSDYTRSVPLPTSLQYTSASYGVEGSRVYIPHVHMAVTKTWARECNWVYMKSPCLQRKGSENLTQIQYYILLDMRGRRSPFRYKYPTTCPPPITLAEQRTYAKPLFMSRWNVSSLCCVFSPTREVSACDMGAQGLGK